MAWSLRFCHCGLIAKAQSAEPVVDIKAKGHAGRVGVSLGSAIGDFFRAPGDISPQRASSAQPN